MSNTALPNQRNKFRIKAVDEKAYLYYEQPEKTCVASAQDSDSKRLSEICVEISRPVTKKSL